MINEKPRTSDCTGCHFVPFCFLEEENLVVKRLRHVKRKEMLCLPQHKFQNFYAIQQGALKTYQVEAGGKELIRGFYFAGEILGYEAIYSGYYPFSAISLTDTLVCEIPYETFIQLAHSTPSLQKHAFHIISKQLNAGAYLALTTAKQRLASFLIDLATRLHRLEKQWNFILPMPRQDIGNYLKLTAETISRIFSQLQRDKIMAISHKKVHVLEPEKLQLIAEGLL